MNNLLLLFLTLLINTSLPFTFTLTRTRLFGPLKASPGKGAGDDRGLEDRNVPTEHKGLPDALGDGKAHGAAGAMSPTEVTDAFKAQVREGLRSSLPSLVAPSPTITCTHKHNTERPATPSASDPDGGPRPSLPSSPPRPRGRSLQGCCRVRSVFLPVRLRLHVLPRGRDAQPRCDSALPRQLGQGPEVQVGEGGELHLPSEDRDGGDEGQVDQGKEGRGSFGLSLSRSLNVQSE